MKSLTSARAAIRRLAIAALTVCATPWAAAQDVVVTALRERFSDSTKVDINHELTQLIELQNSFAANARIIQVVDELFDVLFRSL